MGIFLVSVLYGMAQALAHRILAHSEDRHTGTHTHRNRHRPMCM